MAGGTDLLNQRRLGLRSPHTVIDLCDLQELRGVVPHGASDQNVVTIGGLTTVRDIRTNPSLATTTAALQDAASLLGGRQIQAMATVGGNVCNASPAAELATPLLVHRAVVEVIGPEGRRTLPLAEMWLGPGRVSLSPGEILVAFRISSGIALWPSAYRRLELRRSVDIAVVSASAALNVDEQGVIVDATVAVGAVGPVATTVDSAASALIGVRLVPGEPSPAALLAAATAGRAAASVSQPIDDVRASGRYRRAMCGVVTKRAVVAAMGRWTPPK